MRMWKRWLLLLGAILAEVLATLSLRAALDAPLFSIGVVVGYIVAFALLGWRWDKAFQSASPMVYGRPQALPSWRY